MFKKKPLHLALAVVFGVSVGAAAHAASGLFNIDINRALGVAKDTGTALTPMPESDEIALGRELAGRTMGAAPLINDRALQAYVNRIGRQVAAQSERPDLPWRFGVMDSPSINAFAAPGGVILITRGLYQILDNEAQLAGVLGHEVAHVAKYHHANVVRKQAGTSAAAGAAQIGVQQGVRNSALSGVLSQALGTGAELFAKKLDRSAETEADQLGALLSANAGYSTSGLIDVLHKLNAHAGEPSMNLLYATHPHPTERLSSLGDFLAPRMAKLPEGSEPPLQVAASSLPPPVKTAARPAPAPGRGLNAEASSTAAATPPAQETGTIPGLPGNLNPGMLRGLFGR